MSNPYKNFPPRQYWSRAVSKKFNAAEVPGGDGPLLRAGDKIVTAGSCFAANLVPYIEKNGFKYVRTEYQNSIFSGIPTENLSYAKFSSGYGNIYTARQLLQLLLRCVEQFSPVEDRWITEDSVIDPFRPGLLYRARSEKEFEVLTRQHLLATRSAIEQCDVFIFTLGLTEAWVSNIDGAVFPACPGTVAGTFDASKHEFVNFSVNEVVSDIVAAVDLLKTINPRVRVILTVSPVPLVATATDAHVLAATIYSKSVLRVAAEMACQKEDVRYFPAYEIVTGPQAPKDFYEDDKRNVSKEAVDTVMTAFLANCEGGQITTRDSDQNIVTKGASMSALLMDIECEEAAQDA